jgi:hypothetical protein
MNAIQKRQCHQVYLSFFSAYVINVPENLVSISFRETVTNHLHFIITTRLQYEKFSLKPNAKYVTWKTLTRIIFK